MIVGITDCSKYRNYEAWIKNVPGVEVIRLSHSEKNLSDCEKCDGIILSGGEDIHPRFYNRNEFLEYCHEIDEYRDDFEWKVLEFTENNQVPVLGICRGLQVANVFFGGTLIPDIPAFGKFNHSRFPDKDREHSVLIDRTTELFRIAGVERGDVNSAHHQSAELVGKGLITNCLSADGIIEGLERKQTDGKSYLMLVQWHPERMENLLSPLSKNIRSSFLDALAKR